MTITSLAQGARQSLARGLEALQALDAPPGLLDVAQPVARAVGGLVDIELSPDGLTLERVDPVLEALREALRLLQLPEHVEHPAAARGMKAVAEALAAGLSLSRSLREAAPPSPPAPWQRTPSVTSMRPGVRSLTAPERMDPAVITRTVNAVMGPSPASVRVEAPSLRAELSPLRLEPTSACALPMALRTEPLPRAEPSRVPRESMPLHAEPLPARVEPVPPREPLRSTQAPPAFVPEESRSALIAPIFERTLTMAQRPEPLPAQAEPSVIPEPSMLSRPSRAPESSAQLPREPRRLEPVPASFATQPSPHLNAQRSDVPSRAPVAIRRDVIAERDLRAVDAPLGAHSPSNFYTGFAGGDVVASGGLFVATYQVPKIGEKVLLTISLPGGYEFVAKAKVAWTREASGTLGPGSTRGVIDAPGFGAQFCEITEEGRRLIQRYVRNREPLFHEDAP